MAHNPRPHVIIIAGPNGAGKTTLAPLLLRDTFGVMEYVNADAIAVGLSAFQPERVALEAGRIMLRHLRTLAAQRRTFAFESTLATRSYAPWIRQLCQQGYAFHVLFLWLRSPELAVQRVKERVRLGGHDVPEVVVRRRYQHGIRNFFDLYLPLATSWVCMIILCLRHLPYWRQERARHSPPSINLNCGAGSVRQDHDSRT